MNVVGLYHGFLGSEGTRFPGQDTVDINFTHWRNNILNGVPPPLRQRATAITQGITFISPETVVDFVHVQGEPQPIPIWGPSPGQLVNMHIINHGPSPPNPALIPHPLVPQVVPGMAQVNGVPTAGFNIPWYHELDETSVGFGGRPSLLHHYEHKRRQPGTHDLTPQMVANGKHKVFRTLHFGTQLNMYRMAK